MATMITTDRFTYYLPPVPASEIDQKQLEYSYYAQIAPDGHHLVLGQLQQGEKPAIGNWMDVANVNRDLPKRYFVQYTDFDTLVPGSLIQADRFPEGKWKEVAKRIPPLHRFVYNDTQVSPTPVDETWSKLSDVLNFNFELNYNVLPVMLPDHPQNYIWTAVYYRMYYFKGSWEELGNDVSKLVPFNSPNSVMRIHYYNPESFSDTTRTNNPYEDTIFDIKNNEPGDYILVVAILDDKNRIIAFGALENYVSYPLPA